MTEESKLTKPIIAPYFCLARATWIACVVEWDRETGEIRRLEGFQAFATHRECSRRAGSLLDPPGEC